MNWNKCNTLYFINLIRERPVIWDASLTDHKKKHKKYQAIEEVSKLMGMSIKEVNTKWASLRGQYNREKRKCSTDSGAEPLKPSKWFAYSVMESLMGCNIPEESFCNVIIEEEIASPCTYTATSPPPTTSTPPPATPTPPPKSSSIKKNKNSWGVQEALRTLQAFRDRKTDSPSTIPNDDISAFGSYVSAQLRQFDRRLQSKAKLGINKLLYTIELEHIESLSSSSVERSPSSNLSYYLEEEDSVQSSTPSAHRTSCTNGKDGHDSSDTAIHSVVVLDNAVLSPPTTQANLTPDATETKDAIGHFNSTKP